MEKKITKIYKLDENENLKEIEEIVEILKNGGLVAIPTETVYGLAADGLNNEAVQKIFIAKKRPNDNPLILHISEINEIYYLVKNINEKYIKILEKLWPGPLTVIFEKSDIIPDGVTAGLDTVAIRMPDKKFTRDLIKKLASPLAAPSANLSTKPSPTNAKDVLEDMDGRIDAIIDGGSSNIGIESTVLDLSSYIPKILRPGFYTQEILENYFEKVEMDSALKNKDDIPKSPGQKYKHYAPNAEVIAIVGDSENFIKKAQELNDEKLNVAFMIFEEDMEGFKNYSNVVNMGSQKDLRRMAKILFETFREMDDNNIDLIIVHGVEEKGFGLSIMNRLKKAASNNVKFV